MMTKTSMKKITPLLTLLLVLALVYTGRAWLIYQFGSAQYTGDIFIQEDPERGFSQRPGISTRHTSPPDYSVFTDSLGLRTTAAGQPAPGKVDLLAVGDGYTWGHGVNDQAAFIRVLERRTGLSAANAGMAGYGLANSLLTLKKFSFLQPRVVILAFNEDDLHRSLEPCAPGLSPYCRSTAFVDFDQAGRPFIQPPVAGSPVYYDYFREVLMNHPFGWQDIVWRARVDWLGLTRRNREGLNAAFAHNQTPERREQALQFLLGEMTAAARQISARLVLVYVPSLDSFLPAPAEFEKTVQGFVDSQTVFYVNMTDTINQWVRANGHSSLLASELDPAPNDMAHELIAKDLQPLVTKLLSANSSK